MRCIDVMFFNTLRIVAPGNMINTSITDITDMTPRFGSVIAAHRKSGVLNEQRR